MKLEVLVAVPPGVVTEIGPVLPPLGTEAVICVAELTVKLVLFPLNVTAVVPAKFVPLMMTDVLTGPLVGEKLEMVGAGTTVNVGPVAVPPGVVTAMGPVVAPAGTVATIWLAEFTV